MLGPGLATLVTNGLEHHGGLPDDAPRIEDVSPGDGWSPERDGQHVGGYLVSLREDG